MEGVSKSASMGLASHQVSLPEPSSCSNQDQVVVTSCHRATNRLATELMYKCFCNRGDKVCLVLSACRQLFADGRMERWCNVMLTYHDSCARAISLACRPAASAHLTVFGTPGQITRLLAEHMEAFVVSLLHSVVYQICLSATCSVCRPA